MAAPAPAAEPVAIALALVHGTLPPEFPCLARAAVAEGYRFLDRLADDWASGAQRFTGPGECLLAARLEGHLVGIGGLTHDPYLVGAYGMRRFFIRPDFRRRGIVTALAQEILAHAPPDSPIVVNAGTELAPAFWQALGFTACPGAHHTHILGAHRQRRDPGRRP